MDTPADRLRHARLAAGFATAAEAATRHGWNVNTYKSHENGQRNLRPDRVALYASVFQVSPAWIHFGEMAGEAGGGTSSAVHYVPVPSGGFAEDPAAGPPPDVARTADVNLSGVRVDGLVGERDLPVYASALGGPDGEMIVSFEPIERVRRPAPLEGVNGGFGFYMIGDSMSPAFEPGDMILCHPTRPPYAGQDVLVIRRIDSAQCALVKRLVKMDGQGLVLRQFNPPRTFNVPRGEIVSFHLVVGKYSRR